MKLLYRALHEERTVGVASVFTVFSITLGFILRVLRVHVNGYVL